MKPIYALGLILFVWSLIYLSYLGERELRGEEARRIIPAQEMIDNDQWIVPTLAGETYGNKPPLINWLIAGAFLLTGSESEWAARLPSALSILVLASAAFVTLKSQLGSKRAVSVSLILLTAGSMIEKCRMAEIESVFITLFGLACLTWIFLWTSGKSPWLIWTLPYLFLGIGCLAKGPVHLPFWLIFIFAILKSGKCLKQAFHPAHILGLTVVPLIFLPWVFSNLENVEKPDATIGNWVSEITGRFNPSPALLREWTTHPPELLLNFLPWTIPLAFSLWFLRKQTKPSFTQDRWNAAMNGCVWTAAISAIFLCSIPGGLPRYILPIYLPLSIGLIHLYYSVEERQRDKYESFVYISLRILGPIVLVAVLVGSIAGHLKGFTLIYHSIIGAFISLIAFDRWLSIYKSTPGVFISVPVFIAIAFVSISSVTIPFEREEYQFRAGAHEIINSSMGISGKKVFYADSVFRKSHPRHLRLLYYLNEDFISQGESQTLPKKTRVLIGRKEAIDKMREISKELILESTQEFEIDGLKLTGMHFSAAN